MSPTPFSIHTELHRSKTSGEGFIPIFKFSIHTELHRSKTKTYRQKKQTSLVSIRNYIALKLIKNIKTNYARLVSIRNYIALKQKDCMFH